MTTRRKLQWTFMLLSGVAAIGALFTVVDYNRTKNGKPPIFCVETALWLDGGTRTYRGFGYTIVYYHSLNYRVEPDDSLTEERLRGPSFNHCVFPIRMRNVETVLTPTGTYYPRNEDAQQVEDADAE